MVALETQIQEYYYKYNHSLNWWGYEISKIYIGNNNAELDKKGYICFKYDAPAALKLKDCKKGSNFSIDIDGNVVYEVLDIKFLNDNLDEIVFENTPKRKEIEKHTPNTIITKNISLSKYSQLMYIS